MRIVFQQMAVFTCGMSLLFSAQHVRAQENPTSEVRGKPIRGRTIFLEGGDQARETFCVWAIGKKNPLWCTRQPGLRAGYLLSARPARTAATAGSRSSDAVVSSGHSRGGTSQWGRPAAFRARQRRCGRKRHAHRYPGIAYPVESRSRRRDSRCAPENGLAGRTTGASDSLGLNFVSANLSPQSHRDHRGDKMSNECEPFRHHDAIYTVYLESDFRISVISASLLISVTLW